MKKVLCVALMALFCLGLGAKVNEAKFVSSVADNNVASMQGRRLEAWAENEESEIKNDEENTELKLAELGKAAILLDAGSGTVIFEKNADERLPIASMTKMMSLSIVFDAIEKGKIDEDTSVNISETAADVEGSSAFLDANQTYKVGDLIKTVVIASANDSTVALAEQICGSEAEFVSLMNKKAKELGLTNTHFSNSTGLPTAEHFSSARDCAEIYKTIMENPIYQKYCRIWLEDFIHPSGRKTELVNTNRLVKTYKGCDSGKTGYTSEAKYCLTCSAIKNDMRLIAVVIGEPDSKTRFKEVAEMFNFGFANYESKKVLAPEDHLTTLKTRGGRNGQVGALPFEEFYSFCQKGEQPELNVNIIKNDLRAPVSKGDVVGQVIITDEDGIVVGTMPLISMENDGKQSVFDCFYKIIKKW